MGDVCTGNPTQTIFATSTSQAAGGVSTSTSRSVSVGQGSVVTRSVQSGTEWVFTESSVGGSTATVPVEVPITISGEQQVFTVPISTLFAPCTSSSSTSTSSTPTSTTPTSTPTPTSTTPTSTPPTSTETPESETSEGVRTSRATSPTSTPPTSNTSPTPVTPSLSTPTQQPASSTSATGTLTVLSTAVPTTLPNGAQSTVVVYTTSSIAPSGALNGNDNGGNGNGGSGSNSGRAVAIGVGVAGGVIALIILIFGITWHIRRKRRNAMPLDDSEIWGPHTESKTPPPGTLPIQHGAGYTYNPYSEVRPAAYAPVPTMSPPRARPMVLAESDDSRLSAGSYGPVATGLTAPLLTRAKTADQILYEAAREGLPKSRASSATASHHTRPSETVSHRANQSYAASHKTHGSMASRTSGSAVGLLDHPAPSSTHGSLNQDAQAAQRYQDLMDAPAVPERPMSPVSIAAPRLAIVNPDVDKDL